MNRHEAASRTVLNFLIWSSRTLRRQSSESGLSFVQLVLIRSLDARGPMRMGAASEDVMLADGVMTGVVDRLEERGVVERLKDKSDRRATLIALTPKGHRLAREIIAPYEEALNQIFSGLDDEAVEKFARGFERLASDLSLKTEEVVPG